MKLKDALNLLIETYIEVHELTGEDGEPLGPEWGIPGIRNPETICMKDEVVDAWQTVRAHAARLAHDSK